jgi:ABC-type nickel/cobalt efflux system permease component RcnA
MMARKPSTWKGTLMRRVVGAAAFVFWASGALVAVLVVLSLAAPELQDERSFPTLGGAAVGLAMITSAFLFWHELRADRRELRASRQESRDIPVKDYGEWSPKAWIYAIAFIVYFVFSWFLLPNLLYSSFS